MRAEPEALHPLSHHDIIGLVEPFTRAGRRVDLTASDRLQRRLVFKPIDHLDPTAAVPALREIWQLDNPRDGHYRLTRTLTLPCGLQAALATDGKHLGEMLALIESVALRRQFTVQAAYRIAESHRLEAPKASAAATAGAGGPLILTHATACVDTLVLTMTVPTLSGIPAEIALKPADGEGYELPEDLLAVQGWSWTRLIRVGNGWKCSLRLRGKDAARSRDAEAKLQRTARHLAETLAEPPRRFHERWGVVRWRVTVRRAVPLVVTVALIGVAAAVPSMGLSDNSLLRMVIFQSPPLLLALVFCLRELPQIEVPPWPRALVHASWRHAPHAADTAAAAPATTASATTPTLHPPTAG